MGLIRRKIILPSLWALFLTGGWFQVKIAVAGEQPLFTFAAIADPHISLGDGSCVNNAEWSMDRQDASQILQNAVNDINSHSPSVAFTVVLGDITSNGKQTQLTNAKTILDGLRQPYHVVVGNHDSMQNDNLQAFKSTFGLSNTKYSFDFNNFHFIVLDSLGQETINFLHSDIQNNLGKRTFIFDHYPLWDYNGPDSPWYYTGDPNQHNNVFFADTVTAPLRQEIEASGQVIAYVNGHGHVNRYTFHKVGYATIGSLIAYPAEIRYFAVYPDRTISQASPISDINLKSSVYSLAIVPFDANRKQRIDPDVNHKNFSITHP